jgi:hypothetical protein
MNPVIFEVRCNLTPESPLWKEINSLALEIGYPGRGGQILWKHIGWLRDQLLPAGKSVAHALWNQATAGLVLIFDFLPVTLPDSNEPDKTYRIRKKIEVASGRSRTLQSKILTGEYKDEHFTLSPKYPEIPRAIQP